MSEALRERLQQVLGPAYVVGEEFATGGMSRVFAVQDTALGRTIVVKVLSPELAAGVSVERFKREIAVTARLQHPHIVPIFSAGEVAGLPFYTMPRVSGDSLRARLMPPGKFTVSEALGILRDITMALEHAHVHGVIHRDIKPENVLLAGRSAVVTDFGVAKALEASTDQGDALTSVGLSLGTPAYMAPEQAAADPFVDHRADLYALGVLAYELLTGQTPFGRRSPRAMIAAHIAESPRPIRDLREDLPDELCDLVMQLLQKEPDARPPTATALLLALESIVPGGGLARRADSAATPASAAPMAIAVLPFRHHGGSADAEYLSDGIAEEILNTLARVPALRVAARSSSFAMKDRAADLTEVGRLLGVQKVVDGTLRQAGRRVRVTAQLNNAETGLQEWSDRFDRELQDVFDLQDEIAGAIVGALKVALFDSQGDAVLGPKRPTADAGAYELYLKGRFFLNRRVDGMWKAMEYYQQALERDPDFALAHAGVAEGYFLLTIYSAVPPHEGAPKARAAAERALALDPSLAEAEVVLSNYWLWYGWDPEAARRHIERALRLKPSDPLAYSCLAYCHASDRRYDEALVEATRATTLDPLGIFARSNLAVMYYLAGRFEDAVRECRGILELSAHNSEALRWMALSQFHLGQWKEAFAVMDQAIIASNRHHWPVANMAAMLARGKRVDAARTLLAELRDRAQREPIPPLALATVHYGLGDLDEFFEELSRAVEARDFWLFMLHADPGFDAVRQHPRFAAIRDQLAPTAAVSPGGSSVTPTPGHQPQWPGAR